MLAPEMPRCHLFSKNPEDIEDYTSRYLTYFGVEYNSDTVKKIRIRDEMSLIMLLNKIQTVADLSEFFTIPPEEINCIVKDSPTAVIDIIVVYNVA